jgi:myo-inositol 2-dehydrogenase/D-chiro-inositol 1-dehydrogenase
MIHDFDMARYLMGCEVVSVFAQGGVLIDPAIGEAGDVDTAMVMLNFENGALGVIDNSRKAVYGYDQRVEVFGNAGCTKAGNDFPDNVVTLTSRGVVREKPYFFFLERYFDAYVNEAKAFVEYVISGNQSPCGSIDAMMPVVMGLAAKKSLKEGRLVKISEIV